MIKEAYCSFEISKLLKEKGFDEYCYMHYEEDGSQYISDCEVNNSQFDEEHGNCISAPTHQMACAWLRKVHNIHILPEITDVSQINPKYYVVIWKTPTGESYIIDLFDSPEKAIEAALKYSLENLI